MAKSWRKLMEHKSDVILTTLSPILGFLSEFPISLTLQTRMGTQNSASHVLSIRGEILMSQKKQRKNPATELRTKLRSVRQRWKWYVYSTVGKRALKTAALLTGSGLLWASEVPESESYLTQLTLPVPLGGGKNLTGNMRPHTSREAFDTPAIAHHGHISHPDADANSNANPLMLLACTVNTPIHINRSHLLALRMLVLCGWGLST